MFNYKKRRNNLRVIGTWRYKMDFMLSYDLQDIKTFSATVIVIFSFFKLWWFDLRTREKRTLLDFWQNNELKKQQNFSKLKHAAYYFSNLEYNQNIIHSPISTTWPNKVLTHAVVFRDLWSTPLIAFSLSKSWRVSSSARSLPLQHLIHIWLKSTQADLQIVLRVGRSLVSRARSSTSCWTVWLSDCC